VTNSSNPLTEIVEALLAHGFVRDAQELQKRLPRLASTDPTERASAANEIIGMCHPKWLGDLNVPLRDWWDLLDRARIFTRQTAKASKLRP